MRSVSSQQGKVRSVYGGRDPDADQPKAQKLIFEGTRIVPQEDDTHEMFKKLKTKRRFI